MLQNERLIWVAAAMGTYICGLTLFARQEASQSRRGVLVVGWLIANAGLASAVAWAGHFQLDEPNPTAFAGLLIIAALINGRAGVAIVSPNPQTVQRAVRSMLLAIPLWNASLIAMTTGDFGRTWVLFTAFLVVPAALVGRFLKLT